MWLPIIGIALGVGVSLLRGGRLDTGADTTLRALPLLFVALLLQTWLDAAAGRGSIGSASITALLLLSESAIVAFVLLNWFRAGMFLIAVGFSLNAIVILANGGMPVSTGAIRWLGADPHAAGAAGKHLLMTEATRLRWLADVIPVPVARMVISPGDVLLVAGIIPLAHDMLTVPSLSARRQRRDLRWWPRRDGVAPSG